MRLSARERESRSRRRKVLWEKLEVLRQNTESMSLAPTDREPNAAEKIKFGQEEQAKLLKELRTLDWGFMRQRAWSQGKLLY